MWARSLGGELAEESKTDNVSQRLISCFTTTFCFSRHRFILLTDLSTKNTTAQIASRVQKQNSLTSLEGYLVGSNVGYRVGKNVGTIGDAVGYKVG